jgi:hypothetical protein
VWAVVVVRPTYATTREGDTYTLHQVESKVDQIVRDLRAAKYEIDRLINAVEEAKNGVRVTN